MKYRAKATLNLIKETKFLSNDLRRVLSDAATKHCIGPEDEEDIVKEIYDYIMKGI